MEASALRSPARAPVISGFSPHLRLQSDERLVALVRRGHEGAFEALVKRYQARLLAFCRHMVRSSEDAEDILQEVFTSAYKAILADERAINVRPWLYRIARNRCLNHLRRPQDAGQESMDVFERDDGGTAADTVHRREEFRQIILDVQELPEAQRSALLLREINALSYDQIAEAMETTVPSVKSLLVRARMGLAEAAEARHLTCAEVRLELSQAAEGITKPAAPSRRHVRTCPRCRTFKRELRRTSHALAAIYPVGPLLALKSALGAKLGGGGVAAGAVGEGSAVSGGAALMGGGGAAGTLSAAGGSVAAKAAAGLVAAAIVTAGAVEVKPGGDDRDRGGNVAAPATQGSHPIGGGDLRPLPAGASEPARHGGATTDRPSSADADDAPATPVGQAPPVAEETVEEPVTTTTTEEEEAAPADTAIVDSESTTTTETSATPLEPPTGSSGGSSSSGGSGDSTSGGGGGNTALRLVEPLQ